jgi:hypothetical protein
MVGIGVIMGGSQTSEGGCRLLYDGDCRLYIREGQNQVVASDQHFEGQLDLHGLHHLCLPVFTVKSTPMDSKLRRIRLREISIRSLKQDQKAYIVNPIRSSDLALGARLPRSVHPCHHDH